MFTWPYLSRRNVSEDRKYHYDLYLVPSLESWKVNGVFVPYLLTCRSWLVEFGGVRSNLQSGSAVKQGRVLSVLLYFSEFLWGVFCL